jgi:uncharacterized protein
MIGRDKLPLRGFKMSKNKEEILGILRENKEAIRRFGVKSLSLFGSYARGEASQASDLDFLVEFERKSFDAYMGLKEFLENLFGCHVDLVLTNTIKPRLRTPILREAVHATGL